MTVGSGIYLYIIVSKEVVVDRRFSILSLIRRSIHRI